VRPGNVPLIQALLEYQQKRCLPLHMPGHKQGAGQPDWFKELLGAAVFNYDLTELPGLDDLHNPQGAILAAQQAAARCFGAEESFFLINGSTVGLQAMILAAAGAGEEILIPRQAHRSVISGLILAGARPRYLPVEIEPFYQIPLGTRTGDLSEAIAEYPKAQSLLMVHPNFYGITSCLPSLLREAQANGLICLTDEAHGPHFRFHPGLPISALEAGADATVQSLHKLLASLTQTSLLHRQGTRLAADRLRRSLDILQSTSPSYILMSSLDAARWQVEEEGTARLDQTIELAEKARQAINQLKGLHCLGAEIQQNASVGDWDPTKLVIRVSELGLTGYQAQEILRTRYRIQVEMADYNNVLAMLTLGDGPESAEDLVGALRDLAAGHQEFGQAKRQQPFSRLTGTVLGDPLPEVVLTPREAFFGPSIRVIKLEAAEGEVSAETICPYPPGVPLLTPGERITRPIIEMIIELSAAGAAWQGPLDKTLTSIRVLDEL
jgi:arginine decarboxylase